MKKSRYTRYFKYPLDCLIAAFLILLTSPVLLSTILLLAIANRGSGIFFLQERPGKNGKIFRIIKFKTMNDKKDKEGNLFVERKLYFWVKEPDFVIGEKVPGANNKNEKSTSNESLYHTKFNIKFDKKN